MMGYSGIIQARVGSSRLPGKMLLRIGEETILEFLLGRLKLAQRVDEWVVATGVRPEEDEIEALAASLGFKAFRGSQHDLLDRMYRCAEHFGMDTVVRVGGDNPLLDPRIIDETIEASEHDSKGWDYFSNHHPPSFPDGQEVEIIPLQSLKIAWQEAREPHEREHGTPFLWDRPDRFRIGNYARPGEVLYTKYRWTLDYVEDYELIRRIVESFGGRNDFSQEEIIDYLGRNPDVFQINAKRHGETWHIRERDKLRTIGQYSAVLDRATTAGHQKRRICCITGSRAEYSRLRPILLALAADERIELQLVCSGTHLLERYGNSLQDIVDDGLEIKATCYILVEGETPATMSKSIGLGVIEFSNVLANLEPDVLVVMGDRFDAMSSAIAGSAMNIPIAHVQGGELSGSVDEALRHAITKLAHLHFPATHLSRQRILMMGEDPQNVFNVGCSAVDTLLSTQLMSPNDLLTHPLFSPKRVGQDPFSPADGYVLALFHPVTTEYQHLAQDTMELVMALDEFGENVFWVWPNADAGARKIIRTVDQYLRQRRGGTRFDFFDHVPMDLFVSLMAGATIMVGNSSAGIREACYFGVPVVNVGTRQQDRERAPNVVDVQEMEKGPILAAMRRQRDHGPFPVYKIYGGGDAGAQIARILAEIELPGVQKRFHHNSVNMKSTKVEGP